jgi:predicted O-linked N-acetylglucosamine transferase (SPINDLY family)
MSQLMVGVFECHNRSLFEITAFSFGHDKPDKMTQKLKSSFDNFFDVKGYSDEEIVDLARQLEIDIAVDLMGYTTNSRSMIFFHRCAPIQVNYLGYPGTMSSPEIDYIVADNVVIPEQDQKFFLEKVLYLPDTYYPTSYILEALAPITPQKEFTREKVFLPEHSFVFCCFNNSYKIAPAVFDIWMNILKGVEGSVLWLLEENESGVINLRKEAHDRGVSPDRIVFAKKICLADHLARQKCADLFLDTLPYNAHTTATDALWAGLPVLTRIGDSFASRVAASLLKAVGLPELVTTSIDEYEQLAIRLATHPDEMRALKQKLADNRLSSKLFDTPLYVRQLEAAYIAMHERYEAGLEPDHIYIQDESKTVG